MKCIKNIVNARYIKTLNLNSLFVLKKHTKTLNNSCIESNNQTLAITWLSITNLFSSANIFSHAQQANSCVSIYDKDRLIDSQYPLFYYHQSTNFPTRPLVPLFQTKSLFQSMNVNFSTRILSKVMLRSNFKYNMCSIP